MTVLFNPAARRNLLSVALLLCSISCAMQVRAEVMQRKLPSATMAPPPPQVMPQLQLANAPTAMQPTGVALPPANLGNSAAQGDVLGTRTASGNRGQIWFGGNSR